MSLLHFGTASAAASKPYRYEDDSKIVVRELRDSLEDLKQEIRNHEIELRMFQEKLTNQDISMETLLQQTAEGQKAQKEQWKGNAQTLESKITQLETTTKHLVADLKTLKDHLTQTVNVVEQTSQKLAKFENAMETQNQNLAHLETALSAMMEGFQVKHTAVATAGKDEGSSKAYLVKAGDSLGKIAQDHKISLKVIRELNPQLKNDKIIPGQRLQIP